MAELRPVIARPAAAERYLGIAGAVIFAAGVVAICGSPAALWSYAEAVGDALWSLVAG